MVEEEQSHPNGQAALELTRLNEVEGFIEFKATNLSMGDPMLAEDLAQEAREAVIRRLRQTPDCPYSHLVNKAKGCHLQLSKKGSQRRQTVPGQVSQTVSNYQLRRAA